TTGRIGNYLAEEQVTPATDEEVASAKRSAFGKGDKVRLLSGGGRYPLNSFKDGKTYTVDNPHYEHGDGPKIEIRLESGFPGYADPDQIEKVTEASAPEPESFSVGDT